MIYDQILAQQPWYPLQMRIASSLSSDGFAVLNESSSDPHFFGFCLPTQ